ncbi:hypothetical protein VCHC44C1_3361A, partial [Vibrio cholerae HC-44C1]
MRCQPLRL